MTTINFVGDIALFKEFQRKRIDPFKELKLPDSDYNIGNFEFVISNDREKKFFDVEDEYKVDYSYFSQLNLDIFHALGLANNHIIDYGREGIDDMVEVFKNKNIKTFGVGEESFNSLRFTINNISFAIIGCVKQGRWIQKEGISPDLYDREAVLLQIKTEKENTDHVIIFPHMGTELVDIPAPDDVRNARAFIDAGASAVIGHHPHIVQGVEEYNKGIIAYSLGSFIYLPQFEIGYSKNQKIERDFSICLRLSFSKESIKSTEIHYYKLNRETLIPNLYVEENNYFTNINKWIDQPSEYYKQIRGQLLKRELVSFYHRFKENPFHTLKHYIAYIKLEHIKKLLKK